MKKRTILFCLILVISWDIRITAQSFAIFIDAPSKDLPVNKKAYGEIIKGLRDEMNINGWVLGMKNEMLEADTSYKKADNEIAADYLLSIYFTIYEEYDLEAMFDTDTTKNVIGAYFPVGPIKRHRVIITDLRTNEVLQYSAKFNQDYNERNNGKQL